jgi:hypothetical protein
MSVMASAIIGIAAGVVQADMAGKAQKEAEQKELRITRQLEHLEANRQEIVNPWAQSAAMLTNPFAQMGVATQAAEFQAGQTDISLANQLDAMRESGFGAGTATATAREAALSKEKIAAGLEQQEYKVGQLRAGGEQTMQARLADFQGRGAEFVFGAQEDREIAKLNRLSALQSGYSQQAAAYQTAKMEAIGNAGGSAQGGVSQMPTGG